MELSSLSGLKGRRFAAGWLVVVLVALFVFPLIFPRFWVGLLTEILILGLAGMSVNFLLGYSGSLPFGHAAFYATGAYTVAILIKNLGTNPVIALMVAPFAAAATGAIFGLLIARLYRFYYAMMTTAFSMVLWTIIRKWSTVTHGDDGITGIEFPAFLSGITNTYYFTLIIVLLSILVLALIIESPFGWTLRAIRENSNRVAFINVDVVRHRYFAFVISSFFCGIAGALYIVFSHSTFPDYAYWVKSGDFVTMCILGGMLTFIGPMIGAAILTVLQTLVTSVTLYWPLVMGIVICSVVLLMPEGVAGIWSKAQETIVQRRGALAARK